MVLPASIESDPGEDALPGRRPHHPEGVIGAFGA